MTTFSEQVKNDIAKYMGCADYEEYLGYKNSWLPWVNRKRPEFYGEEKDNRYEITDKLDEVIAKNNVSDDELYAIYIKTFSLITYGPKLRSSLETIMQETMRKLNMGEISLSLMAVDAVAPTRLTHTKLFMLHFMMTMDRLYQQADAARTRGGLRWFIGEAIAALTFIPKQVNFLATLFQYRVSEFEIEHEKLLKKILGLAVDAKRLNDLLERALTYLNLKENQDFLNKLTQQEVIHLAYSSVDATLMQCIKEPDSSVAFYNIFKEAFTKLKVEMEKKQQKESGRLKRGADAEEEDATLMQSVYKGLDWLSYTLLPSATKRPKVADEQDTPGATSVRQTPSAAA